MVGVLVSHVLMIHTSYDQRSHIKFLIFYQVNFYRFSISWPRIFTDGTASSYNQKGMDYYISLVDELVNNSKSLLTNTQPEAPARPHK